MIDVSTTPATNKTGPASRRRTYRPNAQYIPVLATLSLLIVMYTFGAVSYENFTHPSVLLNLFTNNAFLLVVAVGMTFVILTGGIDLSVGAVIAMTSTVAATLLQAGWPAGVVIPVVLLVGGVLGLGMGAVIHFFKVEPFIATLAGMFLARGIALLINQNSIPITNEFWTSIAETRIVFEPGVYISGMALVALAVVAVAAVVLAWSRFGRNVYAIGGNADSALLMGLPVGRTRIGVYTLSGFCAALGGLIYSITTTSGYAGHGTGTELDAIAAVVIGGVLLTGGSGYVLGTVLGVLVLGMINTIVNFASLNSWWARMAIGVLLFAFIVLQRLVTRKAK
ncbi:galactofuranose ABC transporter, permease protein YjfF [Paractinoplanes atraurantiacus]|uniref:Simple sugar transport system permease protein n=1 Tax=Paractinoplanes atraurantiacus TaxID=1036182 RepID=A0A285HM92_9ACTN|nr:galactofuranose ABC transporter, permease protein YjfF [Actinoplanes atraurantiacus]SNY36869.1 simple sugar transport system permease protein [Actinoplanes atraurantiacus]